MNKINENEAFCDEQEEEARVRQYLADYAAREPRALDILTELTGFDRSSVGRWLNNVKHKRTPGGWYRVFVLLYLRSCGFADPVELHRLPPELLEFGGKIVTMGLQKGTRQAEQVLGVAKERVSIIFRGKVSLTEKQQARVREFLASHPQSESCATDAEDISAVTASQAGSFSVDEAKSAIIDAFASNLETITQLARLIISDKFTDEDRERMHEITENRLYQTVDALRALTSPMARERFLKEQNDK